MLHLDNLSNVLSPGFETGNKGGEHTRQNIDTNVKRVNQPHRHLKVSKEKWSDKKS